MLQPQYAEQLAVDSKQRVQRAIMPGTPDPLEQAAEVRLCQAIPRLATSSTS